VRYLSGLFGVVLLVGCTRATVLSGNQGSATSSVPAIVSNQKRSQIVPLVEHHQHIFGPNAIAMVAQPPSLPAIKLPANLHLLLRERERISGTTSLGDVYTSDAQILDVSEAEDHWARGKDAILYMIGAYTPDTRFVPNAYGVDGSTGYIAGVVRSGESTEDEMHFVFAVKKDSGGKWRIAVESATNKPQLAFAKPITAEKTIQVLDDAGIQRAVVLSVAYWFGDGTLKGTIDEEYSKVRAENDWVIEQVSHYPNRLVAFCGVNPLRDYAIREIERCAKAPAVKGMKIHFGNSRVDVKNPAHVAQMRRFFRAANDKRMAIVAHLWTLDKSYGPEHTRIFLNQILPEAPDVPIQIAHMGGAGRYAYDSVTAVFADAITAGDPRMKNVYFDLATVVTDNQSPERLALFARRLRQIGLDRILVGADAPIINRPQPLQAWVTIRRRLPLTDDELSVIANNVAPYMASVR
jgi:predicted TIM-barrel fold metal-dependent hydrolase